MKAKVTYVGEVQSYLKKDGTQGNSYDVILVSEHFNRYGDKFTQEYGVSVKCDDQDRERMIKFCQEGTVLNCELFFHAKEKQGKVFQNVYLGETSVAL